MPREQRRLEIRAEAHAVVRGHADVYLDPRGMPRMVNKVINTVDRRGDAYTEGTYNTAKSYEDRNKAGAYAEAGLGRARAEFSIFDAEAKGPNASAGIEASAETLSVGAFAKAETGSASASAGILEAEARGPNASAGAEASLDTLSAGAFVKAELASVSAAAGPFKAKAGLAADTGASIGVTGAEVKLLGTGFSVGKKTSVAVAGSELECCVM